MRSVLLIGVGAVAGANLRYAVQLWFARLPPSDVPWATLVINVTGSLVLAAFMGWSDQRYHDTSSWRLLVAVGFCGSYTTFSTVSFELFTLLREGSLLIAALYGAASAVCGITGVVVGYVAGSAVGRA